MIYLTMFTIAFLSGSLLPLGSEALLFFYIKSGYSTTFLIIVATFGNVLGAILNYWLGLKGENYLLKKGYIKRDSLISATRVFNKWGKFSLLLSSLPIIGDPLTFIAGILRYNFVLFLIFVTISKLSRYIFVSFFT